MTERTWESVGNAPRAFVFRSFGGFIMTTFDDYMNRCEAAVEGLVRGKRIHVYVSVLDEVGVSAHQWMIDLKNAITCERLSRRFVFRGVSCISGSA